MNGYIVINRSIVCNFSDFFMRLIQRLIQQSYHFLFSFSVGVINKDSSIREFLIETKKDPEIIIDLMADKGFLAGIKYDENHLLIAVTEKRTKTEIDKYINNYIEVNND